MPDTSFNASALAAHKKIFPIKCSPVLACWPWLGALISVVDHGWYTDLVIAGDGGRHYRIQVKTVQSKDEAHRLVNRWHGARLDYIIIFSTQAQWGYIDPAFTEASRRVTTQFASASIAIRRISRRRSRKHKTYCIGHAPAISADSPVLQI